MFSFQAFFLMNRVVFLLQLLTLPFFIQITIKAMGSDGFCILILLICVSPIPVSAEDNDISSLFTMRDSVNSETPPFHWSCITCAGCTGVAIDLSSMPVSAQFSSCIGLFQSLVRLNFSECGFSSELPDAWGTCSI
jgi:hypothetical protein